MRTLFVSPHADDVCFSLLGVIVSMPGAADLATAFSQSEWVEPEWDGPRGRTHVSIVRGEEDEAFCAAAKMDRYALGFEDSSVRYRSVGNLRRPDADQAGLTDQVAEGISALLRARAYDAVFAPMGLGEHTDHTITSAAARRAAEDAGLPVVFYEDVPYAAELSAREISRFARRLDRGLVPVTAMSTLTPDDKLVIAGLYRSQRKGAILDAIKEHSRRLMSVLAEGDTSRVAERLWVRGGSDDVRRLLGDGVTIACERPRGLRGRFGMGSRRHTAVSP